MSTINIEQRLVTKKLRNGRENTGLINNGSVYLTGNSGGSTTAGVVTFNSRNGNVSLLKADVEDVLTGTITTHTHTGGGGGTGTVTSVGLSLPAIFDVTNSPVTTTGTLTGTLVSQTANKVLAAPSTSSGTPTFRVLSTYDMPDLSTFYQPKPEMLLVSSNSSTTNLTLTNITDLSTTLLADAIYEFEANLSVGGSGAYGVKYGIGFTGTGTMEANINGMSNATIAKSLRLDTLNTASGIYLAGAAGGLIGGVVIKGIIKTTSTGTLTLQQAKVTSGTATVYQNSFLKVSLVRMAGGT